MKIELPPRLYLARTVRVHSFNCIEAELDLGYSVSVKKNIILEGVQSGSVPSAQRKDAKHALVVLLGGKHLVIHTGQQNVKDGFLPGRVYLVEKVHGEPEGLATPYGLDIQLLEVGLFYPSLQRARFDIGFVKSVLNGRR